MTTTLRDRIARVIDARAFMPIANESNLDAYALGVAQRWKEKEQSKAFEFADRIIAELGLAWKDMAEAPKRDYVCIFRKSIYGTSGNELPPPVVGGESYACLSDPGESHESFRARMQEAGMSLRRQADSLKPEPYGWNPGIDWQITAVRPLLPAPEVE